MPHPSVKPVPVKSSNIKTLGHDEEHQQIHVEFHSGKEGHYDGCDKALFVAWLKAPSVGKFHHIVIKGNPQKYVWHSHEQRHK